MKHSAMLPRLIRCGSGLVLGLGLLLGAAAQSGDPGVRMPSPAFQTEVPREPVDLILSRPTRTTVTLSVRTADASEGYVELHSETDPTTVRSSTRTFPAGQPVEVELTSLQPDTRYRYRLHYRQLGATEWSITQENRFTTARPPGSEFVFTVQADSHLDYGTSPEVYCRSLDLAVASQPDFHIDLGDTFMTDKYAEYRQAIAHYQAQRYYLGRIGQTAPLFLVLGNHDGETQGRRRDPDPEAMAVWSNGIRKSYFPNPLPNDFYTGNTERHPRAGLLQDYYEFEWGDAQFLILDPFWYSVRAGGRGGDNWFRTLGEAQYRWLVRSLERSHARYRFVFLHHLVGGESREGRGGTEASRFYEWGGLDANGTNVFAARRPGWPMPIHDLLRQHHVNVVFHGHDHFYARQERDGVVYQLVPQPGHARSDTVRSAPEYGYLSGTLLGPPGIVRVRVGPSKAEVEYVRPRTNATTGGEVADRYALSPAKP
jgi:predicted phosphodiesterase